MTKIGSVTHVRYQLSKDGPPFQPFTFEMLFASTAYPIEKE